LEQAVPRCATWFAILLHPLFLLLVEFEWKGDSMASLKLDKVVLVIHCDCGEEFLAEDFRPICPYCNRKFCVSFSLDETRNRLRINPIKESRSRVHIKESRVRNYT